MDKLFEMMNREFMKAHGTKYQVCQILGSVAGSLRGSKLQVFTHACTVSALSAR